MAPPTTPRDDQETVVIRDMAVGGDGVGTGDDGRIVFVRGALPGETVGVTIDEEKKRFRKGHVSSVDVASEQRVEPSCPHVAAGCGGCGWQHVDAAAQRAWKVHMVAQAFERIGGLSVAVDPGPTIPGLRTSIRCVVSGGAAGYRRARSHEPVIVDSCEIAHPALEEMLAEGRFGVADEVLLRVSKTTGARLAVLSPRVRGTVEIPGAEVVGSDALATGTAAWIEEVVASRRFRISAGSFFQSRPEAASALVDAVRLAGAGLWGRGRLVDLYAGVGLFAATVGSGMATTVVESNPSAVIDARINLVDLDAQVIKARVEGWRPEPADIVVADPPRAGLGTPGVAAIVGTKTKRVVLVSCDAGSLGRDAKLLGEAGYSLATATLIDQFAHTPHVEVVTRFDRMTG